jgi:hypothetical protein
MAGWQESFYNPHGLTGASCPSISLCVAVDYDGEVLVALPAHRLSVAVVGPGTVTSTPIACPFASCSHAVPGVIQQQPITAISCFNLGWPAADFGTCDLSFPEGNAVTLAAEPRAGPWRFAGWSGACSGTGACAVTMNSDQSATAVFGFNGVVCTVSGGCCGLCPRPRFRAHLTALSETYSVFTVGSGSTSLTGRTAARRHHRGTVFTFQLDHLAGIKIAIVSITPGRRTGRRCEREGHRLRYKPRCTRTVSVAILRRAGHAGLNKVAFSGRIGGRALKPGRYRAVFTAIGTAGASPPQTLGFTIVSG